MAYPQAWRERWRAIGAGAVPMPAWRRCRDTVQALAEAAWARLPCACPLCREPARGGCLCAACHEEVVASRRASACCGRCGLRLGGARDCPDCLGWAPAFDKVVAAFDYGYPGDLLLWQFKQQHRFQHGRALAALMAQALQPVLPDWWAQAWLVPIPASRQSLLKRGFNPAAELARRLQARLGARVRADILLRRRAEGARVQKHLPRRERLQAPERAFVCRRPLAGARIVLVDDVMTTGATLHGAAQVLRQAGAGCVWGVVAARTPAPAAGGAASFRVNES